MAEKAIALTGEVLTGPPVRIPPALTKMSVSMSEKTDPDSAQRYIEVVCEALRNRGDDVIRLRMLLGKMALAVKKYKLYQPAFPLFRQYVESLESTYELGKSTIYNAMAWVENLDGVTPAQVEGVSVMNMNTATQAARRAEPSQVQEIMKYAKLPNPKFEKKLQEKGLLVKRGRPEGGARETGTVNLIIPSVNAKTAQRYRANAAEHGGPAKYLNHLMNLDKQ